ncbi:MAG: TonB family protein [Betaproteobacteria bacterium]|nr:TonB family protein [Betaproteobacteria bacterium]
MSLTSSNRLMPYGRSLIPLDLPFTAQFSAFKRTLLEMDDLSRFQYAVGASLLVHAIVLFGVTFRPPDLSKLDSVAPALEVILVNSRSNTKPLNADAVAQHNLDGGGNTDLDRRASSPLPVTRNDKQTTELTMESRRVKQLEVEAQKLMTQMQSQAKVESAVPQPDPQAEPRTAPNAADIMSKSLEIARLEAQISKDWDAYQKRPRRRFLGARAQEFRFARYIEDWRQKIERVGTLNYPEAARNQKMYGSLQLTVSIKPDGTVDNIEINRSSGQKVLDDAARRIVLLGAPYAAFPADIAKDTDILSITRTWTFTRADQLSTE